MKKKLPLGNFNKLRSLIVWQFVLPLLFLSYTTTIAQVEIVKDINTQNNPDYRSYGNLVDVDGTLYFVELGKNLWKTDGTVEGTVFVKELNSIYNMANIGGTLFFVANDGMSGKELWKSDGSESGTIQVKDIWPGPSGSDITSFTDVNGVAYFIANNGTAGPEIWTSDGTAGGTRLVKDIVKGNASGNPTSLVSFSNKLFFVSNGVGGYELWSSDGTTAGTTVFKDITPEGSSSPKLLTVSGGLLYFVARESIYGQEVWKTDGTVKGTTLLKDVRVGSASSFPEKLIDVEGELFFVANDGIHGFEFWKSDGTPEGTMLAFESAPGKNSNLDWLWNNLTSANGYLYYQIGDDVYVTDGTASGTHNVDNTNFFYSPVEFITLNDAVYYINSEVDLRKLQGLSASLVKDINEGVEQGNYGDTNFGLTASGNLLFFVALGENGITSLWKSDGTPEGTVVLKPGIPATNGSNPIYLTDLNGTLYFTARQNDAYQFWKSDGTEASTTIVKDLTAYYTTNVNGTLFFQANGRLWKSDGTPEGTVMVTDILDTPHNLVGVNDKLYFSGYTYGIGFELWRSDGTAAGTVLVSDIRPGGASGNPQNLTNVDGVLYFTANDGIHGEELWRVTDTGVMMLKDIYPGIGTSSPSNLVGHNGKLYFIANNGANGYELWRSNGTVPGTVMVKDLSADDSNVLDIRGIEVVSGKVYFTAFDQSGWSLWRTNATAAGTYKVKDFYPGNENINIVAGLNGYAYVTVSDVNLKNHQLWKTNGTETGTTFVKQLGSFTSYYYNSYGVEKDGVLYIKLLNQFENSSYLSYQIWRTDGTPCGTFKLDYESNSVDLFKSGSTIFVTGELPLTGNELLRINESGITPPVCGTVSARDESDGDLLLKESNSEGEQQIVAVYPNPLKDDMKLYVRGGRDEAYDVSVINMKGERTETHQDLKCNVDYTMGASWKTGMYLLRINMKNKSFTKKVIKVD